MLFLFIFFFSVVQDEGLLKDNSNWHFPFFPSFNFSWTESTLVLTLVSDPADSHTHRDHCFPPAVALIRRDSSCSFSTNNYLTSCHNQIPLIMGTIQRLPGVIKLAWVFLDFQLSPVGGALYPGRWLQLWLGAPCYAGADSSSLAITMRAGLMWWQDRLPALLSLSFVLGLLSVPRPYHQVRVPAPLRDFCLPTLYGGGRPALKPSLQRLLLFSFHWKEKKRKVVAGGMWCWTGLQLPLIHRALQMYTYRLHRANKAFTVHHQLWSKVFDTRSHQRGKQNQ